MSGSAEKDSPRPPDAAIEYGFRGEDITYRITDRVAEIGFTWIDGPRIEAESIDTWQDGSRLTDEEKAQVFGDVVRFVARTRQEKPIVVINRDDPSHGLWETLCATHQSDISRIERKSDEDDRRARREMYVDILRSGKALIIDDVEITSEAELDGVLERLAPKRT